jgi:UDP-N-acetylglucosamine transferase subunit ALG13
MQVRKPLLVMPRRADLGEHRNDHQFATARRFRELNQIMVAMDEGELLAQLGQLSSVRPASGAERYASAQLLEAIGGFLRAQTGG